MELHYILVVVFIAIIIIYQFSVFINTQAKIKKFKSIFPDSKSAFSITEIAVDSSDCKEREEEEEYEGYEEESSKVIVSQIQTNSQNTTLNEIVTALNMYLQKNKGAASDFHLMKDVVERYCDAKEEEINIQQPIPLYLGLMGTMVGIIVGIGFIAVSGGLSSETLMENITSLMTCVAIAMAASLVGIFFTTIISWSAKNATSKVESNKNNFYSWLQTELLPVLSGNTVNALYLLQQNLMTFNQSFHSNIEGLNGALSKVTESSKEQIDLIELIKGIDIKRVTQANLVVLKELKECVRDMSVFNTYLQRVSVYLTAVNDLNQNINEHLNRTAAIERMGTFFEEEINQVKTREQYINEVVTKVDNTLRKTFEQIMESTQEGITQLRNNSVNEFDALQKHYSQQKEEFAKMLQEQKESWTTKNDEIFELMAEMRHLSEVKNSLDELTQASKGQTALLENMLQALKQQQENKCVIREQKTEQAQPTMIAAPAPVIEMPKFPKSIVYMVAIITLLAVLSFGLYIYNSFIAKTKTVEVVRVPAQVENPVHKASVDTLKVIQANKTNPVVKQN